MLDPDKLAARIILEVFPYDYVTQEQKERLVGILQEETYDWDIEPICDPLLARAYNRV